MNKRESMKKLVKENQDVLLFFTSAITCATVVGVCWAALKKTDPIPVAYAIESVDDKVIVYNLFSDGVLRSLTFIKTPNT